MDIINKFVTLVSKTQGRDKVLRLIQYSTLHTTQSTPSSILNVYNQIRATRKVLRFLRTLQYSTKVRQQISQLKQARKDIKGLIRLILSILQNLSTFFFFLSDHRVFLAEINVIDKSYRDAHYPKSYKFYLYQNILGVLKNIVEIIIVFLDGKYQGELVDIKSGTAIIRKKLLDLIKYFLDIFVALHYLNKTISAKTAGIIGVITSIIGILQSLELA